MSTEKKEYTVETKGHVAVLTIRRPATLNTLTLDMLRQFGEEWPRLSADDNVRAIVVTGEGERGFCAGIDLTTRDFSQPVPLPNLDYSAQWIARLQACTKPTIAAINGVAAGGGLGLALGCDIRIASDKARFGTAFSRIGMPVIDGVGHTLLQAVGLAKTLELLYTAEVIDAAEASRIGMLNHVVPQPELMPRAMALAEKIADGPPYGLQLTKHIVHQAIGKSFTEYVPYQFLGMQLNRTYASHDAAEGGRAFLEKRKPRFRGPVAEIQEPKKD